MKFIFKGQYYYLPNVTELVNEVIKNCEICTKMALQSIRAPLHPLISNSPMEICMLDFFGPVSPDPITGAR